MSETATLLEAAEAFLREQSRRGRVHYLDFAAALADWEPDRFGPKDNRRTPHYTLFRTLGESSHFEKLGDGWFAYVPWGEEGRANTLQLCADGAESFRRAVRAHNVPRSTDTTHFLEHPERYDEEIELRRVALEEARALILSTPLDETGLSQLLDAWRRCGGKRRGTVTLNRFGMAFSKPYLNRYLENLDVFNAWLVALARAAEDDRVEDVLDELWRRGELPTAGTILPSMVLHTLAPDTYFPWTDALARGLAAAGLGTGRADGSGRGFLAYCADVRIVLDREDADPLLADAILARQATLAPAAHPAPDDRDGIFLPEGFEVLERLATTPDANREWFASHRKAYESGIRRPLQAIVHHVGRNLLVPVVNQAGLLGADAIVVDPKRVVSRINRQSARPDGSWYYPYLWAAFHPASQGRRYGAQLFVMAHPSGIDVGVALDAAPSECRERLRGHLHGTVGQRLDRVLATPGQPVPVLRGFSQEGPEEKVLTVRRAQDALPMTEAGGGALVVRFTPQQGAAAGFEDEVEAACRALLPWFLAALLDDPSPAFDRLGLPEIDEEDEPDLEPPTPPPGRFDLDWLQAQTHLQKPWLEEITRAAVFDRGVRGAVGQVVLYGPPGTGKTWLAEKIALHLVDGDASRVELVQLHPAFTYEHFMEGFRFNAVGGQPVFEAKLGVLPLLVERIQSTGKRHVLVLDEMNRGDLPQVMGELMYLLSRRGDDRAQIQLRRTGHVLASLSSKLVILGTMNTADRSIAHVDFALRRRFRFFRVAPSSDVIEAHVGRHQGATWASRLATLLEEMNQRLEQHGRGLQIGHSYLLDVGDERTLREVWEREVLPTLEDWLDFDEAALRGFGWSAVRELIQDEPAEEEGA